MNVLTNKFSWSELYEHVYPRIITFGVNYGDLLQIDASVGDWKAWSNGLANRASEFKSSSEKARSSGCIKTSMDYSRRATDYFHFSQYRHPIAKDAEVLRQQCRICFSDFTEYHTSTIKFVRIQAENYEIPGYLRISHSESPLIIMFGGLDSAKEVELYYFSKIFLDRGMSTLCIDVAGQGELFGKQALIPEFDKSVQIIIDFALNNTFVQPKIIGAFGVSLGGHLVLRAAAISPKIQASISLSGFFDFSVFNKLQERSKSILTKALLGQEKHYNEKDFQQLSLSNIREIPQGRVLFIHGTKDYLVSDEQVERIRKRFSGIQIYVLEGAEHVATTHFTKLLPYIGDWMKKNLMNCNVGIHRKLSEEDHDEQR